MKVNGEALQFIKSLTKVTQESISVLQVTKEFISVLQVTKESISVLQVTKESISVLQVTREPVSGTTSHVRYILMCNEIKVRMIIIIAPRYTGKISLIYGGIWKSRKWK